MQHSQDLIGFQKGHTLVKLSSTVPRCRNCGEAKSKFLCRECGLEDGLFCLGCSIFHSKVRQFRGHAVVPISEGFSRSRSARNASDLKSVISEFVQGHVDVVLEGRYSSPDFYYSAVTLCAALLGYYLLVKTLFKGYALIANAVVILLLVRLYDPQFFANATTSASAASLSNGKGTALGDRVGLSKSSVHTADMGSMSAAFPDEFPYPLQGRRAPLRPRTRPYRGRLRADKTKASEDSADKGGPD
ncbi:hypothetical protein EON64_08820 [archaeon]|nr:MAG: hypothetical protein EON64_08820 [archaeon]